MAAILVRDHLGQLVDFDQEHALNDGDVLVWVASTSKWTPYLIASTGSGPVSSVFGRTGIVTPHNGDYTAEQVTGAALDETVVHLAGSENLTGVKSLLSGAGLNLFSLGNPLSSNKEYLSIGYDSSIHTYSFKSNSSGSGIARSINLNNTFFRYDGVFFACGSGSTPLFQVDAGGDLVLIKGVEYSWPGSNSAGILMNDGSGHLMWAPESSLTGAELLIHKGAADGYASLDSSAQVPEDQIPDLSGTYLVKSNNLSDVTAATARTNLGLGTAATHNITEFMVSANNLSEVNPVSARANLGLGTASTHSLSFFCQTANNLSDVVAATARTNLGLGTAATQNVSFFCQTANNLSDVTAATARTNLGLGTSSTHPATDFLLTANNLSDVVAATARTNLGLGTSATHPATDFQSSDADLSAIAGFSHVKGQIIVDNGTSWLVLAPSTDGFVLTLDSGQTSGIRWAVASGGAGSLAIGTSIVSSTNNYVLVVDSSGQLGQVQYLPISQGGTGQHVKADAFDALAPTSVLGDLLYFGASHNVSLPGSTSISKRFLTQTGTGTVSVAPSWGSIAALDLPVFLASGGSHASGAVPDPGSSAGSTKFLCENATWAIPPGTGGGALAIGASITSSTNNYVLVVDGSGQLGQVQYLPISQGGTGQHTASTAFDALAPSVTFGDIIYRGVSGSNVALPGNIVNGRTFLCSQGDGVATSAPAWHGLVSGDLPLFVASGVSHAAGAVPDPGSSAGSTKFLCENRTWAIPAGSGSVTSVALTVPSGFSVGGSPITGSGTLAITTSLSGVIKGNGSGLLAATPGLDYVLPSGSSAGLSVFIGSGSTHAPGIVPDPPGTAGSVKFLCENAVWQIVPAFGGHLTSSISTTSGTPGTNSLSPVFISFNVFETWVIEYWLTCQGSTDGMKFQLSSSSSLSSVRMTTMGNTNDTTAIDVETIIALDTLGRAWLANASAIVGLIHIAVCFTAGSGAGQIQLKFASATGGQTNTVLQNSYCTAHKIN